MDIVTALYAAIVPILPLFVKSSYSISSSLKTQTKKPDFQWAFPITDLERSTAMTKHEGVKRERSVKENPSQTRASNTVSKEAEALEKKGFR